MSFGFGLSLPAYPLRGGGGNNPFNQLGPTLDLSFAGTVTDLSDPNGYTLNTNFITPQYQIAAQYLVWELGVGLVNKNFSDIITFTRASTATYFDSSGVLQSAGNNVPRFDYNPATLAAQGLLVEEQRTNGIRNNTMVGASVPSTIPTNWQSNVGGLTLGVVGTGTENGITYIDVRFSGTPTQTFANVRFEGNTQIVASNGQTWTSSFYVRRVSGSNTNITDIDNRVFYRDSGGTPTQESASSVVGLLANTALNVSKTTFTYVCSTATTAFVNSAVYLNTTVGLAIDITLRIGLPQLEQGAFATSVIPTTTTALTRSADVANVNTLAPWYNATEGTLYVQAQDMSDAAHATSQPRAVSINNGTTNNCIDVSRLPASAQGRARVDDAGVNQFNSLNSAWPLATQAKVALAYKANDFAACLGGGAVFTDNTGTVPTVSALTIGNVTTGGSSVWVGWIQRVAYYPRRLSNAELQAITA